MLTKTVGMRQRVARTYIVVHVALGIAALLCALSNWQASDPLRFLSFLAAAALGSVLKLRLPGVSGVISVSALFVLVGIVNLSLPEALIVGVASMLVQCTWRTQGRPKPVQVLFSVCVVAMAIYVAATIFAYPRNHFLPPISLGLMALAYFCANTFPIAAIIGLTGRKLRLAMWGTYR